jgi:hypothetical protein
VQFKRSRTVCDMDGDVRSIFGYIRGGQVRTFINEGGKEGVTNLGAGHKKGNLTSCPMLG